MEYHNYIVKGLQVYPDKEAKCLYDKDGYTIMIGNREIFIPCTSPCCPKHAHISRDKWAMKAKAEVAMHRCNYFITLPVGQILPRQVMKPLWQSFRRSLAYALPQHKYMFAIEVQNNKLHLHGLLHSDVEIKTAIVKECWYKMLEKKAQITRKKKRSQVATVRNPANCADYATKSSNCGKEIQLLPRGTYHRLFFASLRYGINQG